MIKVICNQYEELTFGNDKYLFYNDFCILGDLEFNICFSDLTQTTL